MAKTILFILFLCFSFHLQMTIEPDKSLPYDNYFIDDLTPKNNRNNEVMWAFRMGSSDYLDYYQGITWKAASGMCFEKDVITTKATFNIGQVLANPSVNLSITNNKYLYDQTCQATGSGLYIPLNIHMDAFTHVYRVDLFLMNTSATVAEYTFSFESINLTPPFIHNFNHPTNPLTIPANSIQKYSFKFRTSPILGFSRDITYWLGEENYVTQYTTAPSVWPPVPVILPAVADPLPIYFDNTYLTASPESSYPISQPNIRLIMNYVTGKVALVGIMVVSEKNAVINSMVGGNSCSDARVCSYGFRCQANVCSACDSSCKDCNGAGPSACTKCYSNSKDWNNNISSHCTFDHTNFAQLADVTITVPPSLSSVQVSSASVPQT